jgi:hypothetical protein
MSTSFAVAIAVASASTPFAHSANSALPPLSLRNLAPPVANSALHERQFLLFIEARQASKKPGKRRTASEKNSSATGAQKYTPYSLTPSGRGDE